MLSYLLCSFSFILFFITIKRLFVIVFIPLIIVVVIVIGDFRRAVPSTEGTINLSEIQPYLNLATTSIQYKQYFYILVPW